MGVLREKTIFCVLFFLRGYGILHNEFFDNRIRNLFNEYKIYRREGKRKVVFSFWCVKEGGLSNESGNGEELSQI